MSALSKLFQEHIQSSVCNDFLHTKSCMDHNLRNLYRYALSNLRYYAPIVFLPLLLKLRRLDRQLLLDTLKYYLEVSAFGVLCGWLIQANICALRNILGKFYFRSIFYWPTMVGGLITAFTATPRVATLQQSSFIQCAVESFLIRRDNFVTAAIVRSYALQTFIFMCCSAFIMHARQQGQFKGFWFLQPNQSPSESPDAPTTKCTHSEQSCLTYLLNGLRGYVAMGLTLDVIKMLMSKGTSSSDGISGKLLGKLRNFKIGTTAFLASYVGIYRFVNCLLQRKAPQQPMWNHLLAGFLSGTCYMCLPKLTLFSYAVMLSGQTLWRLFVNSKFGENNVYWAMIKKAPYGKLLFPLSLAYHVHTYCLQGKFVCNLGAAAINSTTNGDAKIYQAKLRFLENLMEKHRK